MVADVEKIAILLAQVQPWRGCTAKGRTIPQHIPLRVTGEPVARHEAVGIAPLPNECRKAVKNAAGAIRLESR